MTDIGRPGKRLVMRVVLLQMGCAAVVAMLFWFLQGAAAGRAVFGWRMFAPGIAPAAILRRALFAAESLKWFWYVLAVWAALARFKVLPLPLMTGLVVAQFGHWAGLMGMKRG
jgi:hypothetical protein